MSAADNNKQNKTYLSNMQTLSARLDSDWTQEEWIMMTYKYHKSSHAKYKSGFLLGCAIKNVCKKNNKR